MPDRGTAPFFNIDDLCYIQPFAFSRGLSIAIIEWLTIPSVINRYPIADILCLISVELVFNRLSNIRLLQGMDTYSHSNTSLGLY
jgi:hypothetical protein